MSSNDTDVAIVGMACVFPGAKDLNTYWHNIYHGVDAISDVPASRWDPVFYDPESEAVDRFYCKRGGFIDAYADFDALGFGIMPVAAHGAEPDQLLSLQVASQAMADAGLSNGGFARDKTGVVFGRGNYIGAGMTRLEQHVRTAQQLVECLRTLVPGIETDQLAEIKSEFQAQLGGYGADTAIGLVPNLTASRVANRMDLHGPAYTVDGACASSLLAVDQAVQELLRHRADVMLAGGIHLSHDVAFWSVFCQLGALSRSQQIRPFDRSADGLLIGEGVGVVVLKRLEDAEKDNDRIYAVIRGTGVASDGRETSLMVPRPQGQLLALERAWSDAGLDPSTIGLVEAHGTATPVGDEVELKTLGSFFGHSAEGERAVIGSVKSMIGHTMPAAGIAGLIKAALAVHHRVLPPSLHCNEPNPHLESTRFRVTSESEAWETSDNIRRAAVNAFGFGGINAHVILDQHASSTEAIPWVPKSQSNESVLRLSADTVEALAIKLEQGDSEPGAGAVRLAIVNPTADRIEKAMATLRKGAPRRGRGGIWFTPSAGLVADGGKIAFLYPGVEANFEPRVDGVAQHFQLPEPQCIKAKNLEETGFGIIEVARLLHEALACMGVTPDLVAGHSIGEWSAMITSGMLPVDEVDALISRLEPGSLEVPGVVFVAVGAGADRVRPLLETLHDIEISHDNCPHQIILCGKEESADLAISLIRQAGMLCQKLPFRSGFHSPLFEEYLAPHQRRFSEIALGQPSIDIWSATSVAPYPEDHNDIRKLAADHLVQPVRFREMVQALHDLGCRAFVQVGTGSLISFVKDTLKGKPHIAISAEASQRSGLDQLQRVAASLWVEGANVDWSAFKSQAPPPSRTIKLALGVPLVKLENPLSGVRAPLASVNDPVLREYDALMRDVEDAGREVLRAWQSTGEEPIAVADNSISDPERTQVRHLSVESWPDLVDHCFFRQAEGWTDMSDRYPVVPMTMTLELMIQAAIDVFPGYVAVAIESVRAFKWIAVEPPTDVTIRAKKAGPDRVSIVVEGYAEGTVVVSERYPSSAPLSDMRLSESNEPDISATELYDDRWMFHGPAYQGITHLAALSKDGISGSITTGDALGALLDNAGQLFGYWVMVNTEVDRLAMPVQIGRISFYGPHPDVGEVMDCVVKVTHISARTVRADMAVSHNGQTWAEISDWEDWRFDTDERLWPIMRYPERHLYGTMEDGGYCLVRAVKRNPGSQDYLARRYLNSSERGAMDDVPEEAVQQWLNGRVAAKDAVRHWMSTTGHPQSFPAQVQINGDSQGQLDVAGPFDEAVRISVSHDDTIAVGLASSDGQPGIDVRRVQAWDKEALNAALAEDELALLPASDGEEWQTRILCAKSALGMARSGGSSFNLKELRGQKLNDQSIQVDGVWVETRVVDNYAIAWVVI